eukprot:tig00020939_g16051.t1
MQQDGEAARAKEGGGARGDGGAGRAAQAEAYPCLGRGLHPPAGRPYAVSAYFDEANRLSCQELCDNRMRRAVDGHCRCWWRWAARS